MTLRCRATILCAIAMLVLGCSAPEMRELVGTYEAKFSFGVGRIKLLEDGRYEQELRITGSEEIVSHAGRWEYVPGRHLVILRDPLVFDDNFGRLNPDYRTAARGSWNLTVESWLPPLSLSWNPDLGIEFERAGEE